MTDILYHVVLNANFEWGSWVAFSEYVEQGHWGSPFLNLVLHKSEALPESEATEVFCHSSSFSFRRYFKWETERGSPFLTSDSLNFRSKKKWEVNPSQYCFSSHFNCLLYDHIFIVSVVLFISVFPVLLLQFLYQHTDEMKIPVKLDNKFTNNSLKSRNNFIKNNQVSKIRIFGIGVVRKKRAVNIFY